MPRKLRKRRSTGVASGLLPPKDLQVHSFVVGSDEYLLIDFPLHKGLESTEINEGLTPGEREVIELVLQGQSNSDIARMRGTSFRTVANQIASIYRKVGVKSRRELFARHRSRGAIE